MKPSLPNKPPPAYRQSGVVLLILFMILFMVGASVFLTVMNNNVIQQRENADTLSELRAARDVLISYAVLHGDYYGATGAGPGHLPCPDSNNDGTENSPCGTTTLARLPTSITLPSGDIFPVSESMAGIDQQLWYAVSPEFRRNPAGIVNTTVNGSFTVDGRSGIAAVIIAPGEALATQSRPSNNTSNYLEADNISPPDFISYYTVNPAALNDRIMAITAAEILAPISARVAEAIKQSLDAWHGSYGSYPADASEFADATTVAPAPAPAWFQSNQWDVNTSYTRLSNDSATLIFTGCGITYTLDQTVPNISRTGTRC